MKDNVQIKLQTSRLIIRELLPSDDAGIYELDSNPEVHIYVGKNPIVSIEQAQEVIAFIQQQYQDNGIGRWAVIDKSNNAFIGWAGLKLYQAEANAHSNFYELGYRFIPSYWGKGYATEASKAILDYGFNVMGLKEIFAMTDINHKASQHVLEKCGMSYIEDFELDGEMAAWFKITKQKV
jgi:[ribosomal protein S5]-alanine N-acetyltransferase